MRHRRSECYKMYTRAIGVIEDEAYFGAVFVLHLERTSVDTKEMTAISD